MQKSIRFLSFGVAISLLFLSCGHENSHQGWDQGPPEVPFATIAQGTTIIEREYTASIEGIANVEIRPQVSGYLSKIYVDEGDYVRAGQSLFKIEDHIYQEQLSNANAALSTAEANLTTAKINLDRKRELVNSKVVTDIQLQEAQAGYNAAQGLVAQAKSASKSAQINIGFTTIKAPVSGYIGRFNYRLGSLMSPTNIEAITMVSDIKNVYAYFSISENDFIRFQETHPGNTLTEKLQNAPPVQLLTSTGKKHEFPGSIDAVDGQFNKTTGAITLRAKFGNPQLTLRSGNTGKIIIGQKTEGAVLFPIASTMSIQDKVFASLVDKDNKVVQVPLHIAGKSGSHFIVLEGVKPGDQYIVSGFERLRTGDIVTEQKQENQEQRENH